MTAPPMARATRGPPREVQGSEPLARRQSGERGAALIEKEEARRTSRWLSLFRKLALRRSSSSTTTARDLLTSPSPPQPLASAMASTSGSSVHNGADVEKTAGLNGHGPVHTSHHNGAAATPAYLSQEGGAPLNLRNVTPGGHPLDRVRPCSLSRTTSKRKAPQLTLLPCSPRLDDARRASLRSPSTTVGSPTRHRSACAALRSRPSCSRSSTVRPHSLGQKTRPGPGGGRRRIERGAPHSSFARPLLRRTSSLLPQARTALPNSNADVDLPPLAQ